MHNEQGLPTAQHRGSPVPNWARTAQQNRGPRVPNGRGLPSNIVGYEYPMGKEIYFKLWCQIPVLMRLNQEEFRLVKVSQTLLVLDRSLSRIGRFLIYIWRFLVGFFSVFLRLIWTIPWGFVE